MIIVEKELNIVTGVETIIEREATAQEIAEYEEYLKEVEKAKALEDKKRIEREAALAKLAVLGLEESDLKALGL